MQVIYNVLCLPDFRGGGNLYLKLDIILLSKIYIDCFQDQAMYVRTSLRGAKMCEIREKSVLLVMFTKFGKDMMEKFKKKHS